VELRPGREGGQLVGRHLQPTAVTLAATCSGVVAPAMMDETLGCAANHAKFDLFLQI